MIKQKIRLSNYSERLNAINFAKKDSEYIGLFYGNIELKGKQSYQILVITGTKSIVFNTNMTISEFNKKIEELKEQPTIVNLKKLKNWMIDSYLNRMHEMLGDNFDQKLVKNILTKNLDKFDKDTMSSHIVFNLGVTASGVDLIEHIRIVNMENFYLNDICSLLNNFLGKEKYKIK